MAEYQTASVAIFEYCDGPRKLKPQVDLPTSIAQRKNFYDIIGLTADRGHATVLILRFPGGAV